MPSPATEALVTAQKDLLVQTYGDKGRQILADAQAYADGVNAYWKANNITQAPATVNDVIAVTAFIGSIFGAGGGGEASNSDLLGKLKQGLGPVRGYKAWDDVMLADDPEAPHHDQALFDYRPLTGGAVDRLGGHRPRLDRVARPAPAAHRGGEGLGRRPGRDRRLGGRAPGPAGVELPGRRAVAGRRPATRWP